MNDTSFAPSFAEPTTLDLHQIDTDDLRIAYATFQSVKDAIPVPVPTAGAGWSTC